MKEREQQAINTTNQILSKFQKEIYTKKISSKKIVIYTAFLVSYLVGLFLMTKLGIGMPGSFFVFSFIGLFFLHADWIHSTGQYTTSQSIIQTAAKTSQLITEIVTPAKRVHHFTVTVTEIHNSERK